MTTPYHPQKPGALAWPRAIAFYLWIALATVVMGIVWFPVVLLTQMGAHRLGVAWSGHLLASARVILGIRVEVRGVPPTKDCIVAAKHQSFLDILAIAHAVPQCAFIMKRVLLYVPVMGYFARKAGCIPIDRARGTEAMKQITAGVQLAQQRPEGLGQLIIYPEGTRTPPGEKRKYKHGVASLRLATGLDVVPVAVNCGLFWPKKGFPFYRGTAVIEFLPEIAPDTTQGSDHTSFMTQLYEVIETASDHLLAEAGGVRKP